MALVAPPLNLNAWLAQELFPQLHGNRVVVMDNAPFHKIAPLQALLRAMGATLLFLPPYSPDVNLIEHDFATLKRQRA